MKIAAHERFALGVVALLVAVGGVAQYRSDAGLPPWAGEASESDAASRLVADVEQEVERSRRRSRPLAPDERIDVNTASADEIQRLPRVGPALAARVVAHRESHGAFRSLTDLRSVPGIGPALLEGIAAHVALPATPSPDPNLAAPRVVAGAAVSSAGAPPIPVDVNTAGVQELQLLPGVGPVLAARIVEWRESYGPFRTLADLERVPGIGARTRERLTPLVRVGP